MTGHTYTVFCQTPGDPERVYSEEIDMTVPEPSNSAALEAAQQVLDADYDRGMRAVRAVRRPAGWAW